MHRRMHYLGKGKENGARRETSLESGRDGTVRLSCARRIVSLSVRAECCPFGRLQAGIDPPASALVEGAGKGAWKRVRSFD